MNPYDVLEVSQNASAEEIKKAYRSLARLYHPDRANHDEAATAKFKEVAAAYEILSDPQKREQYDRYGDTKGMPSFNHLDPFDLFNSFFGFNNRQQQERGRDFHAEHTIDFLDAAYGCEATVKIKCGEVCPACKGNRAAPDGITNCPACNGKGMAVFMHGHIRVQQTCGHCSGTGKIITKMCQECNGDGLVKDSVPVNIKLPQGIRDGEQLRLRGQGEHKGIPGDAFVTIHVRPHELFERNDDDLTFTAPITYEQAVFGGSITVPVLEGTEEITIPPGTKSGSEIRLIGMGLVNPQTSRRGDCVVELEIDVSMPEDTKLRRYLKRYTGISEIRKKFKEQVEKISSS